MEIEEAIIIIDEILITKYKNILENAEIFNARRLVWLYINEKILKPTEKTIFYNEKLETAYKTILMAIENYSGCGILERKLLKARATLYLFFKEEERINNE